MYVGLKLLVDFKNFVKNYFWWTLEFQNSFFGFQLQTNSNSLFSQKQRSCICKAVVLFVTTYGAHTYVGNMEWIDKKQESYHRFFSFHLNQNSKNLIFGIQKIVEKYFWPKKWNLLKISV